MSESDARLLVRSTQHTLDDLNDFSAHSLRLKLVDYLTDGNHSTFGEGLNEEAAALAINLLPREDISVATAKLHTDETQLDVFYPQLQIPLPSSSRSPLSIMIAEELQNLFAEEKGTIAHILWSSNVAGPNVNNANSRPIGTAEFPLQLKEEISKRMRRSLGYAETYHLTFSLFTPESQPSSWDVEAAVQETLDPLLQAFASISKFTVDTQVQIYAASSPTMPWPEYEESQAAWMLKEEDLSAFINAAEWPLSPSIGAGPTINFILYVPSSSQNPLLVKEDRASSWIIPQWGGVVLLNPPLIEDGEKHLTNPTHLSEESLRLAFLTFSHQLLALLGMPATPASLPLRLRTLIRVHAASLLLSASSTMGSLARLTESLPSIPIPQTVAASVSSTLSRLSSTCSHLHEGRFMAALASARVAEAEAERSFFEKSMVGQVYFPDEHKVAVYLPLLGPIGVPRIVGLVKEVKRWVVDYRAAKRRRI